MKDPDGYTAMDRARQANKQDVIEFLKFLEGISAKETEVYESLWAKTGAENGIWATIMGTANIVDVEKVLAFFTEKADLAEEETAELLSMCQTNKDSADVRKKEFFVCLGLLALKQQNKPMTMFALRSRGKPLIPKLKPFLSLVNPHKLSSMKKWTIDDVCQHFREMGASETHLSKIRDEAINGSVLAELSQDDLKSELSLPLGVRVNHKKWLRTKPEPAEKEL